MTLTWPHPGQAHITRAVGTRTVQPPAEHLPAVLIVVADQLSRVEEVQDRRLRPREMREVGHQLEAHEHRHADEQVGGGVEQSDGSEHQQATA